MKIAILSNFTQHINEMLLTSLTSLDTKNNFILLSPEKIDFVHPNVTTLIFQDMNFVRTNTTIYKKLGEIKADILLNFSSQYPIFYKNPVIHSVFSLESLWYPELREIKFIEKYKNAFVLKMNLKNAKKILTFSEKLKKDLNEKLNIEEEKIDITNGFFLEKKEKKQAKVDIKAKYILQNNYIIYDQEVGVSKNISRFLQAVYEVQKTTPFHVLFLGKHISNDLETRQQVINLGIEKICTFVGSPLESELQSYYQQSNGVFFPHLYDNFPSFIGNALCFNTPIFISKGSEVEKVLGTNAEYFSPLNTNSIIDAITAAISHKKEGSHDEILKKHDIVHFVQQIIHNYTNIF